MFSRIMYQWGIITLSLLFALGIAERANAQGSQQGALMGVSGLLGGGAQTQGNNAAMSMMMAQQLMAAADALNCEEKKKEEKEKCEKEEKRLRDLAMQMMMMAMQQQQSADEMAKKGEEAGKKAGEMGAGAKNEQGAEEPNKVAELEDELKELKEEYDDLKDEKEELEANQNTNPDGTANPNNPANPTNPNNPGEQIDPKFAYLYDGQLGEDLTWFEDEYGVNREDLAATILVGGSIGALLAGKGSFDDMTSTQIDNAIAEYQPTGDMAELVDALQVISNDSSVQVSSNGDANVNDGNSSVAVSNGSVSITANNGASMFQSAGEIRGASTATTSDGTAPAKCETHYEAKVRNSQLTGYVVSICGDKVYPGAVTFSTANGAAKKANSPLANAPHTAQYGYEQWKLKDCNYIYKPGQQQLTIDACKPNIVGTVTINGKDYVGPYFYNVEPLGQNVFQDVTVDRVQVWSATDGGTVVKSETVNLESALNFVQQASALASN